MKRIWGYLPLMIRISLGGIFIYSGGLKIADPVAFAGNVAAYQILPYFACYLVAATLPWIEGITGVLLVGGWKTRSATILVIILDLVFMAAIISAMARGLDIDCGCFRQGGPKTPPWQALVRDVGLLVMAVTVLKVSCATNQTTSGVETTNTTH
jgi:uncharacterized membrane protein YphA (DoxX/SURF4 family)